MRNVPILLAIAALAACKPPATDADMARGDAPVAEARGPSDPLPSPDVEGAIWAPSKRPLRILYGKPGEAPLMALACVSEQGQAPQLLITRFAPADEGAGAYLALIGNSHVARIPVDSVEVDGAHIWQGSMSLEDPDIEVLTGRREIGATLPGAGRLVLNPGEGPVRLIEECRAQLASVKNQMLSDLAQ